MNRTRLRELLMQCICQMDMQKDKTFELVNKLIDERNLSKKNEKYLVENYMNLLDNMDRIDEKIDKFALTYKVDRMEKVSLAILRVAVYEMFYVDDVPVAVAINEAVEMAKKFGSAECKNFVNGILGNISREGR